MNKANHRFTQLTATAYHEAGHAVVCHRLGYKVNRVTIVPSDTSQGLCTHENILRRKKT
jgi:ATP-dependent Zn protease